MSNVDDSPPPSLQKGLPREDGEIWQEGPADTCCLRHTGCSRITHARPGQQQERGGGCLQWKNFFSCGLQHWVFEKKKRRKLLSSPTLDTTTTIWPHASPLFFHPPFLQGHLLLLEVGGPKMSASTYMYLYISRHTIVRTTDHKVSNSKVIITYQISSPLTYLRFSSKNITAAVEQSYINCWSSTLYIYRTSSHLPLAPNLILWCQCVSTTYCY